MAEKLALVEELYTGRGYPARYKICPAAQPASLDALAAAYAEDGAFDRALATATRARELADQRDVPAFAEAIARRSSLYAQGLAYRE